MQNREASNRSDQVGGGQPSGQASGQVAAYDLSLDLHLRMAELEMENLRLQRLVTELLFKNQELRKALCQ